MQLVQPAPRCLASYVDALKRGWSADNVRGAAAVREQLEAIAAGASAFIDRQVDREAEGPAVVLPDGSKVARLPGFLCWMWDGEFNDASRRVIDANGGRLVERFIKAVQYGGTPGLRYRIERADALRRAAA